MKVDYVAQSFVPLGARMVKIAGGTEPLKADVRLYTYAGAVQLTAVRLYQGQATNFRTPREASLRSSRSGRTRLTPLPH